MRLTITLTDGSTVNVQRFEDGTALDLIEALQACDGEPFLVLDLDDTGTTYVARAHITRLDFDAEDRPSASEAPRTRDSEVVDGYLCRHGKYAYEHDCDDHRDRAAGKELCTCGTCLAIRAARDGEQGGER